ncbi:MAG: alpha/beta hydrolase [Desulfobacula sp.]|jgi:acetyl esterase/lipase|uniref:alpha/beta hydrolase n=3 Tax=Desulfobacula sp. TaxID=2593537 RepID=UPI001D97AC7B|nr:alpha/beta hydrolase [Desulfobacula sp.]MBT3487349.1 alpha/beta hydrolase [Desulfobacula sp.]MBT3806581.1 alpha/beta hydrolase [Desulfobacula sp.]MBT4026923.1 alpha/beta hydrolase [Desulfobacula sp.]MBT4200705.1 alpha/beta hydrolase [Desulfobacula sp.]
MSDKTSHILSAILRHLKSQPTFKSVGIKSYRNLLEKSALAFKPGKSIIGESFCIKTIEAQWLMPLHYSEKRIIMFIHGGGYIAGSINSHRDLASRIAVASDAKVLIFNYRLAPEHPFPKGFCDVRDVYQWLADNFRHPHKISLVADSAGAGLGLALLSELLAHGLSLPVCSVLISPWIDLECKNRSHIENRYKDPMLSQSILKRTARLYTDLDISLPLISPINNDFSGCSPVLIQTGGKEVLIDDSKILAKKLKTSGVKIQLEIWEEMFHVWHYFAKYLSQGRQAIKQIGSFIKKYS